MPVGIVLLVIGIIVLATVSPLLGIIIAAAGLVLILTGRGYSAQTLPFRCSRRLPSGTPGRVCRQRLSTRPRPMKGAAFVVSGSLDRP
mgnify:FL=1